MVPPQQGFGPADSTRAQVELRLVVQHELATQQSLSQLAFQRHTLDRLCVHPLLEIDKPTAA